MPRLRRARQPVVSTLKHEDMMTLRSHLHKCIELTFSSLNDVGMSLIDLCAYLGFPKVKTAACGARKGWDEVLLCIPLNVTGMPASSALAISRYVFAHVNESVGELERQRSFAGHHVDASRGSRRTRLLYPVVRHLHHSCIPTSPLLHQSFELAIAHPSILHFRC